MVRKKIDNRIRVLIENGVALRHRSMFVVVGDKGRDQVVILHHMLSKSQVKTRPSVLWCYKKDLGFSSHRRKRMKQIQKKIKSGKIDVKEDDPFELFIAATDIRYCYYSETHKILGNTYGMLILQDFEALTPNLLARTIETVEGGGLVVILMRTMTSLRQLYTLSMDVHARYRTEAHQDVVARFNERFLLSLGSCQSCTVLDDQLNILPISSSVLNIQPVPARSAAPDQVDPELKKLQDSLQDTQPVASLINLCRTIDQAKSLLKFVDAISEKSLRSTVAMTASRGRGKSAALGLAIACAVAFRYSNIFVTSPSPENLKTLFSFVFKGLDALEYQEHTDYEIIQSTNPEFNKAVVRVSLHRDHRQTIQYIHPSDAAKLGQAELVVIDEAAAIPLPLVKALLGNYLCFLSSTINGYEGTGRSLSLKLIDQLRQQSGPQSSGRQLHEIVMTESIRYAPGDPIETWLTDLLCLDCTCAVPIRHLGGCPPPDQCDLYYVNRDALFSYHKTSEAFLKRLMALYVASHYKNTPNDLQMLSDAPAHHIFCLLGPIEANKNTLPDVLCVIQICFEGEISKQSIMNGLARGQRASGDLIPWTVSQQFQDTDFGRLSGGRIVRIATHPDYQSMGYGGRALAMLQQYFEGKMLSLEEDEDQEEKEEDAQQMDTLSEKEVDLMSERVVPRKNMPPLLLKLTERKPEKLDYLGVSFGITSSLLKFWKRAGYAPVYLRQTQNDLTGEHSCIMLKTLHADEDVEHAYETKWLIDFFQDFRRRFISLLSFQFATFQPSMSLAILQNKRIPHSPEHALNAQELLIHLTQYDIKRLEMYTRNLVDYHLIMDLVPTLARLYFLGKFGDTHMSAVQSALMLGVGLQHKSVDDLAQQLELPSSQILGLFNRTIKKLVQVVDGIQEKAIEGEEVQSKEVEMLPVAQSLDQELNEAAVVVKAKQRADLDALNTLDLKQYEIKGTEVAWGKALQGKEKGIVSIGSRGEKRKVDVESHIKDFQPKKNKKKNKNR